MVSEFKDDIPVGQEYFYTFQTIAQTINAVENTAFKDEEIEIGDVWALYFWCLEAWKTNLDPDLYDLLKYSPGGPFTAKSFQSPSQATFAMDPGLSLQIVLLIREQLMEKYLETSSIDDNIFILECMNLIFDVIKATPYQDTNSGFPPITNSTEPIIFMFSMALRTILKDTQGKSPESARRLRNNGILAIAGMVTMWHFKTES